MGGIIRMPKLKSLIHAHIFGRLCARDGGPHKERNQGMTPNVPKQVRIKHARISQSMQSYGYRGASKGKIKGVDIWPFNGQPMG